MTSNDDKVSILLVDDIAANLDALVAAVESPAYRLVRAGSGQEALRQVLENDFAAIVLDVMMPGMDGFETARLIKSRERSAHIPILFLTAVAMDQRFRELGYEAGAVDYLVKPVDEFILRAKLEVFADLFRAKEALRSKSLELARLQTESDQIQEQQRTDMLREHDALNRYVAKQATTAVTSRIYGELPVHEGLPELFGDLVKLYVDALNGAVEARFHETAISLSDQLQNIAKLMFFVSAGPRDVIEVHKQALADSCKDKTSARIRALTEEGRYLLVELMGSLLNLYRSKAKNRTSVLGQTSGGSANETRGRT